MSKKSQHIAQAVQKFTGRDLDAHYLAYFACFNRQEFYEAHDVLEELWLKDRRGSKGDFYKGLIQLAGAFVHVQKSRTGPAQALLRLARANLSKYPSVHQELDLVAVISAIEDWSRRLETPRMDVSKLVAEIAPRLALVDTEASTV